MTDPLDLSLDLLRRLPPSKIEQNLETIVNLIPAYADDLYSSVDQPLKIQVDSSKEGAGREFLCCDYNRDGDSWRSHISNSYAPPIQPGPDESISNGEPGTRPSAPLRALELKANSAFETYAKLYYENALSSVYLWDLESDPSTLSGAAVGGTQAPSTFAGVVLFKKSIGVADGQGTSGAWDSLHVFEATERASSKSGSSGSGANASYKLTSTVMLGLTRQEDGPEDDNDVIKTGTTKVGTVEITGSLTRQSEADYPLQDFVSHISNIGRMIEDMEAKMRNQLQEVYFGKTRDVVGNLRSTQSLEKERNAKNLQKELMGLWKK